MEPNPDLARAHFVVDVWVEVDLAAVSVDRVTVDIAGLGAPVDVTGVGGELLTPADQHAMLGVLATEPWPTWDYDGSRALIRSTWEVGGMSAVNLPGEDSTPDLQVRAEKVAEMDALLAELSDDELAKTWARCMRVMRERELIRTANPPVGDFAERVACAHLGLT